MFDIGWSELVVIGVVALIAIGPKELPGALRALGLWMGKVRRMAADFQHQFQEAMREAEMADIKKEVETLTSGFDPIESTRKEIESAFEDKPPSALVSGGSAVDAGSTMAGDVPSAYAPAAAPLADTPSRPEATAPPEAVAAAEPEKAVLADTQAGGKPGEQPA
jgi:sec-independent protein translocase protein TatB